MSRFIELDTYDEALYVLESWSWDDNAPPTRRTGPLDLEEALAAMDRAARISGDDAALGENKPLLMRAFCSVSDDDPTIDLPAPSVPSWIPSPIEELPVSSERISLSPPAPALRESA